MSLDLSKYRGDPCQATPATHSGALGALCKEPAEFLYIGLKPTDKHKIKLGITRSRALLCAEHARELITDFGWAIKDGECAMERLSDVKWLSSNCRSCGAFTRVAAAPPIVVLTPPGYCPMCGAQSSMMVDPDRDYWEIMSESFGNMDFDLLKMLYADWQQTRNFPRFRDYVERVIADEGEYGDGD